jgi:adenine-specific DNA-methyltransferase
VTTDALGRLQALLRELFQFESKELDFGIYRIMNHKRTEIRRFIDEGLPTAVDEALKGGAMAQQAAEAEELRRKTDRVKETFGEYAIDAKGELNDSFRETPLGKEYLEARSRSGSAVDLEELKATIFNHVYTFFARYYDNGDFLSKRRYSRKQKYAVPYNGEEVYLHWANADQYYVKTGEHFTDYRYKAPDGITVHFELTAADTEQNNVKGHRRFFVPRTKDAAYDADARALTVPFEYRPLNTKEQAAHGTRNQQEKIIEEAAADLPAHLTKHPEALAVLEPAGDLMRHLRRYTRRNTSDFFVHKDLKCFLNGELDFYLKNEVIDVDDLEAWGPDRSDGWFEVMRAVKRVGRDVIAFLAQIEDFQKMLFEKKKLVVSAEYCLTLDRVPEELYEEIAANDAQREEWVRLFAIDEIEENITQPGYSEPLTEEFLKANPFLVLDTKHFDEDFKDRLLASIEDLDGQSDGLLIESENFQALNLLQERYREQVKCIYIDPPYNTGGDGFLYKDGYQHSSWMTMMHSGSQALYGLLRASGSLFVHIDDNELGYLLALDDTVFDRRNRISVVTFKQSSVSGPKAMNPGLATTSSFVLWYAKNRSEWDPQRVFVPTQRDKRYNNYISSTVPSITRNGSLIRCGMLSLRKRVCRRSSCSRDLVILWRKSLRHSSSKPRIE